MKADSVPSKAFETVDEITEAKIIIAVVNGGEFSARRGLKTVSIAKKQPATAALKPEDGKKLKDKNQPLQSVKNDVIIASNEINKLGMKLKAYAHQSYKYKWK